MRLPLPPSLATLIVCLTLATPAIAFNPYTGLQPADSYPQLGPALQVARTAWPANPCNGHEYVAFPTPDHPDGQISLWGSTGLGMVLPGCRIYLSSTLTGYMLCAALVHETGHLAGQTHSPDPDSIMSPHLNMSYQPCLDATKEAAGYEP